MADDIRGGTWTAGRDVGTFQVPLAPPQRLGEEHSWHYFHPDRFGVKLAPEDFRRKLKEIDTRLEVTWHPVKERWLVWARDPHITFKLCPNWSLVFVWEGMNSGCYMPLDNRCLALVYARSPRAFPNAMAYWQRIEDEIVHEKRAREKERADEVSDMAGDYFDYRKIKNIGSGSKFAESHS